MVKFELSQSQEELTSHSGLALVGAALRCTQFCKGIDHVRLPRARAEPTIAHSDVLKSYVGLLCQGKSDYEAIEPFRAGDEFFPLALDIEVLPSCETLRQRLDQLGAVREPITTPLKEQNLRMLKEVGVTVTPALRELVALDIDVSPFDNSKTHKEGVSRTYKGYDGYAPVFAYLGAEGYLVNTELRAGKQHCQNGTPAFLRESLRLARLLTDASLLARMDSGNDSADNLSIFIEEDVDFVLKRNLRRESPEEWLAMAKAHGESEAVRVGKTVYRGSMTISRLLTLHGQRVEGELRCIFAPLCGIFAPLCGIFAPLCGIFAPLCGIFEVTERTITADGQMLLVPQVEVDTYWTSLPDPPAVIVEQYHQHGTSEQYHSELKSDMDLERLPSGKFSTNQLVLHCAMVAYNMLRMIGQIANDTGNFPFHKRAFHRRIKTVIQNWLCHVYDLIYLAARLVCHARSYKPAFGRWSPCVPGFARTYQRLRC